MAAQDRLQILAGKEPAPEPAAVLPAAASREKVDDLYAARTGNTTALPRSKFAPPFSTKKDGPKTVFLLVNPPGGL